MKELKDIRRFEDAVTDEQVVIPLERYESLIRAEAKLECILSIAGHRPLYHLPKDSFDLTL